MLADGSLLCEVEWRRGHDEPVYLLKRLVAGATVYASTTRRNADPRSSEMVFRDRLFRWDIGDGWSESPECPWGECAVDAIRLCDARVLFLGGRSLVDGFEHYAVFDESQGAWTRHGVREAAGHRAGVAGLGDGRCATLRMTERDVAIEVFDGESSTRTVHPLPGKLRQPFGALVALGRDEVLWAGGGRGDEQRDSEACWRIGGL